MLNIVYIKYLILSLLLQMFTNKYISLIDDAMTFFSNPKVELFEFANDGWIHHTNASHNIDKGVGVIQWIQNGDVKFYEL